MNDKRISILKLISVTIVMSLFLSTCSSPPPFIENELTEAKTLQYIQNLPYTEAEIVLEIPGATDNEIVLELVDDITGIELNPTRYVMNKVDDNYYSLVLPVKVPSILKYRFYKNNGLPIYETDAENNIIEYRLAYILTESTIPNLLTNWKDEQYDHKHGRAIGQVVNSETNSPIPNALVVISGNRSYTNSLGNFIIEKLPPGKHNLVITSTDGEYQTFQQEAIIGEGLTTQANIGLKSSKFVNVSFIVQPPENNPEHSPIRILGNTYQLGNVFGNIYNGTSIAPARAPKLTPLSDGNYSITMSLPSGFDLRYKFSLGDGFWNAELDSQNNFVVRKFVVPDQDTIVNDVIYSWKSSDSEGVEFTVDVPENTPDTDKVSIQFNSFGWSPPIQMWKINNNQWKYQLFGPFHLVGKIDYRFCRNDACDVAFDMSAPINGYSFDTKEIPQSLNVNIQEWSGWGSNTEVPPLDTPEIIDKGEDFITGFSFSDNYNVFNPIYVDAAYQNMTELSANTVVIPVKWTLQSLNPIILAPITGQNPLWKDLVLTIQKAQKQNLSVWLSPEIELSALAIKQLGHNDLSNNWNAQFSTIYTEFLYYTVDLAAYMQVQGIVFPTEVIHLPHLENYELISNLMETNLTANIDLFRTRFENDLLLSFNIIKESDNSLMNIVDGYLITPSINFIDGDYVGDSYEETFGTYLEEELYPFYNQQQKPVFIGLDFPSISGVQNGCITVEDQCLEFEVVNKLDLATARNTFNVDFTSQVELIHAAFSAINKTSWIKGIISHGYNPQVAIMDHSSSVRGKPSVGVFWYWYPRLQGIEE
ncbi:MAG TPA: carboxypeptidase-like regulatory domain-containing protein [Anaerolineaceae bacterium]|nr:carboxypeptidase-like regulatory domain-containing protein [Anaerolineaceae bacterium]